MRVPSALRRNRTSCGGASSTPDRPATLRRITRTLSAVARSARLGHAPTVRGTGSRAEEVAVPQREGGRPPRQVAAQASDVVEEAARPLRLAARVGLVAYGLVHLVLAALIAQVALGERERADKKGALQEIAETTAGRLLLWVVVAGLVALVITRLVEALSEIRTARGPGGRRRGGRIAVALGEAVVFAVLARSAATIAQAEGGDSFSRSVVAGLFDLPGGPFLVGLVGAAVAAAGVYAVQRGVRRSFLHDLAPPARLRRLVTALGAVGWTALGVAAGTVGSLLIVAAVQFDPTQPVGLDGGIRTLADEPFGPALLLALAAGLAVFAVFCLFDARYRTE